MLKLFSKYLLFFSAALVFGACARSGYISSNDVYLQKPNEIVFGEDETDLTSYNSFLAQENGEFQNGFTNDRNRNFRNNMRFLPMGTFVNGSIAFVGSPYGPFDRFNSFGWHNPYRSTFYNYNYGGGMFWNYHAGSYAYFSPLNAGYYYGGYGYPYNIYGGGYYNGFYNGYYNGFYDGANQNQGNYNNQSQGNSYYGHRGSFTLSSNRTSNGVVIGGKAAGSSTTTSVQYDVDNQKLGQSRRGVRERYSGNSAQVYSARTYNNNDRNNYSPSSTIRRTYQNTSRSTYNGYTTNGTRTTTINNNRRTSQPTSSSSRSYDNNNKRSYSPSTSTINRRSYNTGSVSRSSGVSSSPSRSHSTGRR